MNCNELDNYLHEFLDNELAADKRTEVANHLASCRHCAVRVAEFEQADRQLRVAKAVSPPADFLQQVRRKIKAEEKATERASVRTGIEPPESFWESFARRFTLPFWVKIPIAVAAAFALAFAVFHATQSGQNAIPATYQLTKNEVDNAKDREGAPVNRPTATKDEKSHSDVRGKQSDLAGDAMDRTTDFVQAVPSSSTAPIMGEELPKAKAVETAPLTPAESAMALPSARSGGEPLVTSAKPEPATVNGTVAGTSDKLEYGLAKQKVVDKAAAEQVTEGAGSRAEVTNYVSAPVPVAAVTALAHAKTSKAAQRDSDLFAKVDQPSVTNLTVVRQSGWLDLATQTFYVEFGKASVGGAFVRGRLDEKSRFIVTSAQVEGQVIELDERSAGSRGMYGWLELSSRNFVPARPALKPSYPYIEGYQDRQGEFHPTSRRIYQAGN